jgi:hypothetical protein
VRRDQVQRPVVVDVADRQAPHVVAPVANPGLVGLGRGNSSAAQAEQDRDDSGKASFSLDRCGGERSQRTCFGTGKILFGTPVDFGKIPAPGSAKVMEFDFRLRASITPSWVTGTWTDAEGDVLLVLDRGPRPGSVVGTAVLSSPVFDQAIGGDLIFDVRGHENGYGVRLELAAELLPGAFFRIRTIYEASSDGSSLESGGVLPGPPAAEDLDALIEEVYPEVVRMFGRMLGDHTSD